MKNLYLVESGKLRKLENEYQALSPWNIDCGGLSWVEVRSRGMSSYAAAAYSHRASGPSGTLICYENIKARDQNSQENRL